MLVQWLTFAVMILIQIGVAAWTLSAIRTTLDVQGGEIKTLRERTHALAQKVMVIDGHEKQLGDHETRIRGLESVRVQHDERVALAVETRRIEKQYGLSE